MIHNSPWPTVVLPESSVHDLVWSNPNRVADSAVAIVDGPTGRTLTRGALKLKTLQIAYGLRHKLNLKPGAVACLFSPNSFYYHVLALAMQAGGYVLSGANAAYTTTELAHQLGDSGAEVVFVHPSILEVALSATSSLGWSRKRQRQFIILAVESDETGPAGDLYKSFDELISEDVLEPVKIKDPKNTIAFLGYSSGTSGKAKGVRTSHYNMTSVLSMLTPFNCTPADVQIAVLPLSHIYGLTKILHWPILIGSKVVVMPKFALEDFCALVQEHKVTIAMLVPPIALLLARDPIVDKYNMSSMRLVVSGAAPMGAQLELELASRLGTNVAQAFGLTESSPTTHYCPVEAPKPGSIGPLLPMMRGRICDPVTGIDVEAGLEGEMLLQGPNVMMGYLNNPTATAETLMTDKDGLWLKTGDIAFVDEQGYFFITDRNKDLIKYKGHQVAPAELEATLLSCPLVADAAVIGIYDDSQATELPRAYVVLSALGLAEKDGSAAVRAWVDSKVAPHKKLRGGVKVIEAIPKSPSGKLLRRLLRDQAKAEMAAGSMKAKL